MGNPTSICEGTTQGFNFRRHFHWWPCLETSSHPQYTGKFQSTFSPVMLHKNIRETNYYLHLTGEETEAEKS